MKVRNYLLRSHAWIGLGGGLVLGFVALTGAALAFRPTIEGRKISALPSNQKSLSVDEIVASAVATHPGSAVEYVRYDDSPAMPARVSFADKHSLYLDAATGAVLPAETSRGEFFAAFQELHTWQFFSGGDAIAGAGALGAVFIGVTGICLWWPRSRRALRAGLTLNSRLAGRARSLNWHRTFGIYAVVILLGSAVTGLPIALTWARNGLYQLVGSPVPGAPKPLANSAPRAPSLNGFARTLAALVPDARQTAIRFRKQGVAECYVISANAPHPNARTYVYLDAATGEVLRFVPYSESSLGHRLYFWMLSWHVGQVGGIFGQLALFAGALSVPILVFTGAVSYLRRPSSTQPVILSST